MDRRIQRLIRRVSFCIAAVATASLVHILYRSFPSSCVYPSLAGAGHSLTSFPRSSCHAASRPHVTPERRLDRLRRSDFWKSRSASLSPAIESLFSLSFLSASSRVLLVPAAPGYAVDAILSAGISDLTAVDVLDVPPIVSRADPHNLPFFDSVFDLAFVPVGGLSGSLYPARFIAELERTLRPGAAAAVAVERCHELDNVVALFKRSNIAHARNLTMEGSEVSLVILKRINGRSGS